MAACMERGTYVVVPGDAVHFWVGCDGAREGRHAALPHVSLRPSALHLADGHRQDCRGEQRHVAGVWGFYVVGLCKFNRLEIRGEWEIDALSGSGAILWLNFANQVLVNSLKIRIDCRTRNEWNVLLLEQQKVKLWKKGLGSKTLPRHLAIMWFQLQQQQV